MRKELVNRLKLEKERKEAEVRREKDAVQREIRSIVWTVVEKTLRKSEKEENVRKEKLYREEVRMRERDRRCMREAEINLLRKRKVGGRFKYKRKEYEKYKECEKEEQSDNKEQIEKRIKAKAKRKLVTKSEMGGLGGASCPPVKKIIDRKGMDGLVSTTRERKKVSPAINKIRQMFEKDPVEVNMTEKRK